MSIGLSKSRNGSFLYQDNDIYIGKSLQLYGEYSELELALIYQILKDGDFVVDAGANIGAIAIPMAKAVGRSGRVFAFEPQRLVYNMLCGNIAINQLENVYTFHAALGAASGLTRVPLIGYGTPCNLGSVQIGSETGETVPLLALDGVDLKRLDLLVADVEGSEEAVLRGAEKTIRKFRPTLYLENNQREKSWSLLQFIFSMDYQAWWHFPLLFNERNYFGNPHNIFRNIISINILCLPNERPAVINDMKKISSADEWYKA